MLTVLFWIGGPVAVYFGLTFGLHVYRIKTDRRYRDRLGQRELERQMQAKVQTLSEAPAAPPP